MSATFRPRKVRVIPGAVARFEVTWPNGEKSIYEFMECNCREHEESVVLAISVKENMPNYCPLCGAPRKKVN